MLNAGFRTGNRPVLRLTAVLLLGAVLAWCIWPRGANQLWRWTGRGWQYVSGVPFWPFGMYVSPAGHVWERKLFGLNDTLVLGRWDGRKWTVFSERDFGTALRPETLSSVTFADEEFWGQLRNGVLRFDDRRWYWYPLAVVGQPKAMAADGHLVWVLDRSGRLLHFDGGKWTVDPPANGTPETERRLASPIDQDLAVMKNHQLWLIWDGVSVYDGARWREMLSDGKPLRLGRLAGRERDRLWFEDGKELTSLSAEGRIENRWPLPPATSTDRTWWHVYSANDRLWLVYHRDVLMLEGRDWKRMGPPVSGALFDMGLDGGGTPWLTCNTGMSSLLPPPEWLRFLVAVVAITVLGICAIAFWKERERRKRAEASQLAGLLGALQDRTITRGLDGAAYHSARIFCFLGVVAEVALVWEQACLLFNTPSLLRWGDFTIISLFCALGIWYYDRAKRRQAPRESRPNRGS